MPTSGGAKGGQGLLRLWLGWKRPEFSGARLRLADCPRRPAEDFGGVGGTPAPAPETGALPEPKRNSSLHRFDQLPRRLLEEYFCCDAWKIDGIDGQRKQGANIVNPNTLPLKDDH